ncbi:hypothetical protein K461DRAFT_283430 [Myriangium duriaei CBS 260.36]|uniref:Uncharacterized protein n=1 Tax=Myriangium duriaei CBS 260.36 TaxID=1168546 RepID=A0A9P4MC53_9PEZI|nr:hypothetical protein K461DRAFT_283430 [Myriangium duriaei CBS 260.36]
MQQCVPGAIKSTLCAASWLRPRAPLLRNSTWRKYTNNYSVAGGCATQAEICDNRLRPKSIAPAPDRHGDAIIHPSRREGHDVSAWIDRLEPSLPAKLRNDTYKDTDQSIVTAGAIFSFISDARRLKNHDILLEFSRRGRWKTLVWLVTYLVDNLWRGNPTATWRLPEPPIGCVASLDDLVEKPIKIKAIESARMQACSIDGSILVEHPLSRGIMRRTIQGYQTLGEIWQSLGFMIIEDAAKSKDSIQPEILELIAVLHSRGIMPDSIYSYSTERSSLAGTQPPTLRLLSSQIMTSLSDAAWNARQASALEEARSKGDLFHFQGPELPSSDYRVRVAGVRHEIWLELVLWSCLHGGWVQQGIAIVEALIKQKGQSWSPLSWRETMSPLIKVGDESSVDWVNLELLFGRGHSEFASDHGAQYPKIEKTISSEVVSAYVDAIVNLLSSGVGERGAPAGNVVRLLVSIKKFLEKNNFGLESTSWDAVVQRILESESINVEEAPGITELLLSLSASYGDEEGSLNVPTRDEAWRPMSPYLSDGSALTLGLSHRTLSAYIDRGEFAGAFRTFRELQSRTDNNKRLSIAAFFRTLSSNKHAEDPTNVNFSSPLASINYPGMFPMLPATVLAPFLDLVTEIKAFHFGSWLVASQDVDGPTVGPLAYRNPMMVPSLIRFLAASRNEELLNNMMRTIRSDPRYRRLPADVLLAILESQFGLNNPDAAMNTFDTIVRTCRLSTADTEILMAILCREVIRTPNPNPAVREKLRAILQGELGKLGIERRVRRNLTAIMMHIDDDIKDFCGKAISLPETIIVYPETRSFNLILEGCVTRHGSIAGRALLCAFSQTAQRALADEPTDDDDDSEKAGILPTKGSIRPGSIYVAPPSRIDLSVERARRPGTPGTAWSPVQVLGRFSPNASSVRVVLNKRLQEIRLAEWSDLSWHIRGGREAMTADAVIETDETVQWAKRMLKAMGMRWEDILQEAKGHYDEPEATESRQVAETRDQ